ncbi:MAG: hypothetical protein V7633_2165, partial [Pseudonocardia sp.]
PPRQPWGEDSRARTAAAISWIKAGRVFPSPFHPRSSGSGAQLGGPARASRAEPLRHVRRAGAEGGVEGGRVLPRRPVVDVRATVEQQLRCGPAASVARVPEGAVEVLGLGAASRAEVTRRTRPSAAASSRDGTAPRSTSRRAAAQFPNTRALVSAVPPAIVAPSASMSAPASTGAPAAAPRASPRHRRGSRRRRTGGDRSSRPHRCSIIRTFPRVLGLTCARSRNSATPAS